MLSPLLLQGRIILGRTRYRKFGSAMYIAICVFSNPHATAIPNWPQSQSMTMAGEREVDHTPKTIPIRVMN